MCGNSFGALRGSLFVVSFNPTQHLSCRPAFDVRCSRTCWCVLKAAFKLWEKLKGFDDFEYGYTLKVTRMQLPLVCVVAAVV